MRSFLISCLFFLSYVTASSQQLSYKDSLDRYQKKYVSDHEVVKGSDKDFFRFYPIDQKYRAIAKFKKIADTTGFVMKSSGTRKTKYFRYGLLYLNINKKDIHLTVYQSEKLMSDSTYKDYLFVPFTDLTSGEKSYGGGRYLDFFIADIKNNTLIIDFNKSYNPYCAYVSGFSCPIPPAENDLPIMIEAGEMEFAKKH